MKLGIVGLPNVGKSTLFNVLAGEMFDVPILGTHAHSWIMSFPDEYTAFLTYAKLYPQNTTLLVDTYDTLHSGVPNAIRVAEEVLKPMGKRLAGIRLDSGDIAYLTKKARMMLDVAGLTDCKITASNSLDETLIKDNYIETEAMTESRYIEFMTRVKEFGICNTGYLI